MEPLLSEEQLRQLDALRAIAGSCRRCGRATEKKLRVEPGPTPDVVRLRFVCATCEGALG